MENRKNSRFPAIARVQIPKVISGDALLKDLSVTGCRIECTMDVEIKENSRYTITVLPEESAEIDSFDLMVECKWIHPGSDSCDIGFNIIKSPGKRDFERYVDYLSWRHNLK